MWDGQSLSKWPLEDPLSILVSGLLNVRASIQEQAVGSTAYADRELTASTRVDRFVGSASRTVLVDLGGFNDITDDGLTGVQTAEAAESYLTGRRLAGFDFIIATTMPLTAAMVNNATFETHRQTYNTLIFASSVPDTTVDLSDVITDPSDSAQSPDGTHWAIGPAQEAAQRIAEAIMSLV